MRTIPSCAIARVLSKRGICSRAQAAAFIRDGRVTVNGRVVTDARAPVAVHDRIIVDGASTSARAKRYILLHKPAGYVTTRSDEKGRKTVYDLLGDVGAWVFPVGRLDKDSEGLLIFTNDTFFGNVLTDPQFRIPRTYRVTVNGTIDAVTAARIKKGLAIGRGERSCPREATIVGQDLYATIIDVTLTEGKNREIRRLFETLGTPVVRLVRTSFGPFRLGSLTPGAWRPITVTRATIDALRRGA